MTTQSDKEGKGILAWHRRAVEGKGAFFAVLVTVVMSIGGIAEIAPMYSVSAGPETLAGVTPYTPLEVAGRDIYVREGCYACHSQWIRPFRAEVLRYGHAEVGDWSRAGEYAYDRPFQLGSRRIGPDLMRIGGKYPDSWHYEHMKNPRKLQKQSIMPSYPWLLEDTFDPADVQASVAAMQSLGVPYTDEEVQGVPASLKQQGGGIVASLAENGIVAQPDLEIVAMIAYLQRMGKDGTAAIAEAEKATGEGAK